MHPCWEPHRSSGESSHTWTCSLYTHKLLEGRTSHLVLFTSQRRKISLLWDLTVGSPSPLRFSSYSNYTFAFDRMNQSIISFPCAKGNRTLIINATPLDYSLTIFIIPLPSRYSLSFPSWYLPRSHSLRSPLAMEQTGHGSWFHCPAVPRLRWGSCWDTGVSVFKSPRQSSHCGAVETNPTSIQEDVGLTPGLAQWVGDLALPWAVA